MDIQTTPYRPYTNKEWKGFVSLNCHRCIHFNEGNCRILNAAADHQIDEAGYPPQLVNHGIRPTCLSWLSRDQLITKIKKERRGMIVMHEANQMRLFDEV